MTEPLADADRAILREAAHAAFMEEILIGALNGAQHQGVSALSLTLAAFGATERTVAAFLADAQATSGAEGREAAIAGCQSRVARIQKLLLNLDTIIGGHDVKGSVQ